jgi:hypothetical protein
MIGDPPPRIYPKCPACGGFVEVQQDPKTAALIEMPCPAHRGDSDSQ